MHFGYVLVRNSDGFFVSHPGEERSYVEHLPEARIFQTADQARAGQCIESETVCKLCVQDGRIVKLPWPVSALATPFGWDHV